MSKISYNEFIEHELLNTQGFINIDQHDVDHFKRGLMKIEGVSVECDIAEIETTFMKTLSEVKAKNAEMQCVKILFVIKFSEQVVLTMDELAFINEAIDREDVEWIWGMSVDNEIPKDKLKIIALCGFKE